MIDKVVLMFSPTDEKTPYEQEENHTVIYCSVGSHEIDTS